ncbi:fungal-specific transcription factor domain-containing protein [Mycena floridula]|nr:fungal-specific transcription factor domain-containing protein [Mycena floridula]
MSSDEVSGDEQGAAKKRKIQRACDICRRKKVRCDGPQTADNRCSNCTAYNLECTYVEAAKKRGPPKGYVESLENRLEKMERLLRQIMPEADYTKEVGRNTLVWNPAEKKNARAASASASASSKSSEIYSPGIPPYDAVNIATTAIRQMGSDTPAAGEGPPMDNEDIAALTLADTLQRMSLDHEYRFFGKSSGAMLVQTALDIKKEYGGDWSNSSARRADFWLPRPWEQNVSAIEQNAVYTFPEDDLIISLVNLYFRYINIYYPLLHRGTFEAAVRDKLHLENEVFAANLLLVCAAGSRWSDDPRCLLPGIDSQHSNGWKWFSQVQLVRKSLLQPPSLGDLQFYCLSVMFLQCTSAPQACWTMIGIGIRLAQDVGAHRRKNRQTPMTIDDELWKRAWWVLVCLDRNSSSAMGRPCAIQDEDFDLDLPIECDDEYWEHPDPALAFKQPPGQPSRIAYFILSIKLMKLLAFSLRTIYSINKSKILLGLVGHQWEQHIVAEIDSALNKWIDSVPDHLRWDPNRENPIFFDQSVTLYASYYHLQILIHRPFIPSPRKPSPLTFPSLAICTNAARSCSHVIDIQRRRNGVSMPFNLIQVFTAGIVLLLNIWGGKRSGMSTNPEKEMEDVHKCMQALKLCEDRWQSAGRLWDILAELASVGDLPLPSTSPKQRNKRGRDADSPLGANGGMPGPGIVPEGDRNIASNRRVSSVSSVPSVPSVVPNVTPLPPLVVPPQPVPHFELSHIEAPTFALPIYSNDLGRLPLHGQVDQQDWYNQQTNGHQMMQGGLDNGRYGMAQQPQASSSYYDQGIPTYPPPYVNGDHHPEFVAMAMSQQQNGYNDRESVYLPSAPRPGPVPSVDAGLDSHTMAMWLGAPTGFEPDDWGAYLTNVTEMANQNPSQSQSHSHQHDYSRMR